MRVILRRDLNRVGKAGDIVKVKDGYGRNYLIPQKIAYLATDANLNVFEEEVKGKKYTEMKLLNEAKDIQTALSEKSFTIIMKSGEEGKLFGSVTSQNIADLVKKEIKLELDKKKIVIDESIKTLGNHSVSYKAHADVTIAFTIVVEAEETEAE